MIKINHRWESKMPIFEEPLEELVEVYNGLSNAMPTSLSTDAEVWERQVLLASLAAQIEQLKLLQDIYRVA